MSLTVPELECPDVLLPTPANLANYFKQLASYAYKNEREDIKKILKELEPIFAPYDPKFEKIEIPEIEWEIRVQRLVDEYTTYVQSQFIELINKLSAGLITVEVTIPLINIKVDLVKFATDREYLNTLLDELDVDSLYELLPPEYQMYKDKFDSLDFRRKALRDYLSEKVKELQTGGFTQALEDLGLSFTMPQDPGELVREAVDKIINDANKDIDEQIDELKQIKVGPFTLEQILGGEIKEDVEISEFQRDRFITKLRNFARDYFVYLINRVLEEVKTAIEALGLGKLVEMLTFDFCDFLELIVVPKTIALPEDIQTVNNTQTPLQTSS